MERVGITGAMGAEDHRRLQHLDEPCIAGLNAHEVGLKEMICCTLCPPPTRGADASYHCCGPLCHTRVHAEVGPREKDRDMWHACSLLMIGTVPFGRRMRWWLFRPLAGIQNRKTTYV